MSPCISISCKPKTVWLPKTQSLKKMQSSCILLSRGPRLTARDVATFCYQWRSCWTFGVCQAMYCFFPTAKCTSSPRSRYCCIASNWDAGLDTVTAKLTEPKLNWLQHLKCDEEKVLNLQNNWVEELKQKLVGECRQIDRHRFNGLFFRTSLESRHQKD